MELFEEHLTTELNSITDLNGNIFPVMASKDTKPPLVVYLSSEGVKDAALSGFLNSQEVYVEINILADDYAELKNLANQVLNKIVSFQGRSIGNGGPFVQFVDYEHSKEIYEFDILLFRSLLQFKIRY